MLPARTAIIAAALRHGGSCSASASVVVSAARRSASSSAAGTAAAAQLRRQGGGPRQSQRRHLSTGPKATQSASAAQAPPPEEAGLSTLGTLFFGGLCLTTLGLGCWQSARYFEKVEQMAVREEELQAAPVEMTRYTVATSAAAGATAAGTAADGDDDKEATNSQPSFRRLVTRGTFDHAREMLVGPRGPPPGALSSTGPSSGRSGGGMSSSPQGYYVVTPLRIAAAGDKSDSGCGSGSGEQERTILVNRGWVPMSYVKQQPPPPQPQGQQQENKNGGSWSRPKGIVTVTGVETSTERPKFLSPQHDARTPNRLLWMDRAALEQRTGTDTGTAGHHPLLLTETAAVGAAENGGDAANATAGYVPASSFPVKPTAETVGEFKVTPTTHAGYAVTWFGLSGAGMVMTRKLLTRGR